MPELGAVNVKIGADTQGLNQGLGDAQSRLSKFRGAVNRVAPGLAKMGTAAAGAGAAITAGIVKTSSDAITQQTRLARSLGTTNKQIAGLTSAFKAYGLQQEDVSDALTSLTDRAQDAASGMQSMADDFKLVGLSVDEIRGQKPAELFRTFSDALQDTESAQKRATAAARIFGDDVGRKLLPLLMEGESAIDEFTKRAEEMGLAIGETDATKVEQASIAMSQMQEALAGVGRTLTVEVAPMISAVAESFNEAAREGGGFGTEVSAMVDKTASVIGVVADAVEGVRRTFELASKAMLTGGVMIAEQMASTAEAILSGPVDAINMLIDTANKVPGIDIGEVEQPDIVQGLQKEITLMEGVVEEAKADMDETLMEPFPSDQIDKFLKEAKEKSTKAAEEMKAKRDQMGMDGLGLGGGGGQDGEGEGDQEGQEGKSELEKLKEQYQTKLELERQFQEQRKMVRTAFEQGEIESKQKRDAILRGLEEKHQQKLSQLTKQGLTDRQKFNQKSWDAQASQVAGSLQQMTSSVASENKKMFQLNKIAGIASATINAYQGFNQALAAYPPPLSYAMASAQLASGLAQVQKIKSQSFSGGGSSGGGGGGAPAQAGARQTQPGTGAGEQGGGQQTERVIRVQGVGARDMISGEQLTELLNEANEDGARLVMD